MGGSFLGDNLTGNSKRRQVFMVKCWYNDRQGSERDELGTDDAASGRLYGKSFIR